MCSPMPTTCTSLVLDFVNQTPLRQLGAPFFVVFTKANTTSPKEQIRPLYTRSNALSKAVWPSWTTNLFRIHAAWTKLQAVTGCKDLKTGAAAPPFVSSCCMKQLASWRTKWTVFSAAPFDWWLPTGANSTLQVIPREDNDLRVHSNKANVDGSSSVRRVTEVCWVYTMNLQSSVVKYFKYRPPLAGVGTAWTNLVCWSRTNRAVSLGSSSVSSLLRYPKSKDTTEAPEEGSGCALCPSCLPRFATQISHHEA